MNKTIDKVKVRIQENRRVYIHNDLRNAAYYFKSRISERLKANDREGIGMEMMACLTMIAFAIEANVNFIGFKICAPWNESLPLKDKVREISRKLNLKIDLGKRPYQTIADLKHFRDTLAHGKPIEVTKEFELITTQEELDKSYYLQSEWEQYADIKFIEMAYEDMDKIWSDLMNASGLTVFDAVTHGGRSIDFIEHVKG